MKKWIHKITASIDSLDKIEQVQDISIKDIISLVLVDDVEGYYPRNNFITASVKKTKIPYSSLTREQILELPKRERDRIHDIRALRKLDYTELTPQQQRDVTQANKGKFIDPPSKVKDRLSKLQDSTVFVWPDAKNASFLRELRDKGCKVRTSDIENIINHLTVSDYSYSTLSYLDFNWNCLLMVFEYKGEHTFESTNREQDSVTVSNFDVYIKIDVDRETDNGYAAISFHKPEFTLKHPYADN